MSKKKMLLSLFLSFFKIGLFTFGGGYAMIALIEREFVERKKWLEHDEFLEIIAVAESTPGPIAINSATYIGYKKAGVLGSAAATIAVCIPSFVIIYTISLFFEKFLKAEIVELAFKGIGACVAYLILAAGIKMFKKLKKNPFNIVLFVLTTLSLIAFTLFSIKVSSILFILAGALIGIVVFCLSKNPKGEAEK